MEALALVVTLGIVLVGSLLAIGYCLYTVTKLCNQQAGATRQVYAITMHLSDALTRACVSLSTERTREIVAGGIAQGEKAAAMANTVAAIHQQNTALDEIATRKPKAPSADTDDLPWGTPVAIGVAPDQTSFEADD